MPLNKKKQNIIIIIIIIIIFMSFFFTQALAASLSLESESPPVSRTFVSILADHSNAVF